MYLASVHSFVSTFLLPVSIECRSLDIGLYNLGLFARMYVYHVPLRVVILPIPTDAFLRIEIK